MTSDSDTELVVVVAAGGQVVPGNNCVCEGGFGAMAVLDVGKTVTLVLPAIVRCLRSLSRCLGQREEKNLQHRCLNTPDAADWMTKESRLDTKAAEKRKPTSDVTYITHLKYV